ncbi:hypothetical protein AVEN_166770-1 [Araneus ventricosus]|uniref:Uncharacterized protein n=1 Tax=Araneus ventricosus TaxID=182803 RepID=A0A4Y2BNT9_ARAVE|nr:hypothetical protein AVEN_166770-1 [Araneus ventricosus]
MAAPILDREEILVIDSVTIATPFFVTPPSSSKLEKRIVTDSVSIATPFFRWWNSQDRVHSEFITDFSRSQQKNKVTFRTLQGPNEKSSTFPGPRVRQKFKEFSRAVGTLCN